MIVEKSKHVICCLRNNALIEGTVENWSDEEIVLLSLDGLSRLIIPHPTQDIVFVKIILESFKDKNLSELKQKISDTLNQSLTETDQNIKDKNIRQLRVLAAEQDRKIIKERNKNHTLGQPRIVEYYYPGTNIKQEGK